MTALVGQSTAQLEGLLAAFGQPAYRARQVAAWIYRRRVHTFEDMTDLPAALRRDLASRFVIRTLVPEQSVTAPDEAAKYTFRLSDGNHIESVYLPYEDRVSACVSTQVGCPAGCAFCATGRLGLARNLTAGEIVEQYMALQDAYPNRRISHVVFMGMGEPLLNVDATLAAVRLLNKEVQLSARNLTISTVGIVPGILRLAEEGLPVNLALSIHAPDDSLRSQIVPMARKWRLGEILQAAARFRERTGRDATYEYVLLDGVNDAPSHATALARLLDGLRGSVNVIPYNSIEGLGDFRTPSRRRIEAFKRVLREAGCTVTERARRGEGAKAACGQLAGGSETRRPGRRRTAHRV